jgi:hypothetical protein
LPGAPLVTHSANPIYDVVDVDSAQAAVCANDHSTTEDALDHLRAVIAISATAENESRVHHQGGEILTISIEHQSLGLMFG